MTDSPRDQPTPPPATPAPQGAGLYRRFARPVVGCLDEARNPEGLVAPFTRFERGGARLAVIGASDPHAADESRNLGDWYRAIERASREARDQADLVIVLADTGSGPALWLAERLDAADLIIAARGQDFWPTLVEVERRRGDSVPVCFPGSRAIGVFRIACHAWHRGWRCRYGRYPGQRVDLKGSVAGELVTWNPAASHEAGPPLWGTADQFVSERLKHSGRHTHRVNGHFLATEGGLFTLAAGLSGCQARFKTHWPRQHGPGIVQPAPNCRGRTG
ncbi:MAG: hypothetical protein GBQ79_15025 [Halomonas sp.]|nr:hypothetical protein [Halomonas sp.]